MLVMNALSMLDKAKRKKFLTHHEKEKYLVCVLLCPTIFFTHPIYSNRTRSVTQFSPMQTSAAHRNKNVMVFSTAVFKPVLILVFLHLLFCVDLTGEQWSRTTQKTAAVRPQRSPGEQQCTRGKMLWKIC